MSETTLIIPLPSFKVIEVILPERFTLSPVISKLYKLVDKRKNTKTNVIFKNNNTTLKTQILFHDRDLKEIYFENGGIIKDSTNTIKSTEGKYFLTNSKYEFNKRVNDYNYDSDIK